MSHRQAEGNQDRKCQMSLSHTKIQKKKMMCTFDLSAASCAPDLQASLSAASWSRLCCCSCTPISNSLSCFLVCCNASACDQDHHSTTKEVSDRTSSAHTATQTLIRIVLGSSYGADRCQHDVTGRCTTLCLMMYDSV